MDITQASLEGRQGVTLPEPRPEYNRVDEDNEKGFEGLLRAGKVDEALKYMDTRYWECKRVFSEEYDPAAHKVNRREPKIVTDADGKVKKLTELNKLAVGYQSYINEVALVFMFGQPLKWQQVASGTGAPDTDEAFGKFLEVIKDTHFDARIRQCKRLAGAETECALLLRTYKREADAEARVQLRVLAASKGDRIYTRFDEYENLVAFAWGFSVRGKENEEEERLNVYTDTVTYECSRTSGRWTANAVSNMIGKIPVILFRQEKEWAGADSLIEREEKIASRTADANDYFANPLMVASADVVQNLPKKEEVAKILITNDTQGGVNNAVKYLTWDNAPQSQKDEITWLQEHILNKTFTPDIKMDTLKSLGNVSAKMLRTVMLLAVIKASKRKEVYDEMIGRFASLLLTVIGGVIDIRLKAQCDALRVQHVWQEPFGDDIEDALRNIVTAVDGGILSTESAIEQNPLVTDVPTERQRLDEEREASRSRQAQLFGGGTGASYFTPARQGRDNAGGDDEEEEDSDGGGSGNNGRRSA